MSINDVQFVSAYAIRKANQLNNTINHDVIDNYDDTDIANIAKSVVSGYEDHEYECYENSEGILHFVLDSGEHVCRDTLCDYFDSFLQMRRLSALACLETYFLETTDIAHLYNALNFEAEGNKPDPDFSLSMCLTALPYDTSMMYFSCRYLQHESTPHLHADIMGAVKEALNEMGIEDEILADGLEADDIADVINRWPEICTEIETTILLRHKHKATITTSRNLN